MVFNNRVVLTGNGSPKNPYKINHPSREAQVARLEAMGIKVVLGASKVS